MSDFDDDEFDDEDLINAATQAELHDDDYRIDNRPTKRRRLSDDHGSDSGQGSQDSTNGRIELVQTPEKTSRYRIHVPRQGQTPPPIFHTQLPQASQSPYRIRAPIWQKPRLLSPESVKVGRNDPAAGLDRREVQSIILRDESPSLFVSPNPSPQKVRQSSRLTNNVPKANSDTASKPTTLSKPIQQTLSFNNTQTLRSQPSKTGDGQLVGMRQTTLFGGTAEAALVPTQVKRKDNWPAANRVELPTHHKLDGAELAKVIYPTNLGEIRDYQYSIVMRGLYNNLLVALPTGLGKTFIAATIMLNWYRWTRDAQVVFVAPTKPLVSQQVEACFQTVGIPRSATTMLTGGTSPGIRAEEWQSKRVFFMTPQTIINDLKTGICDPKRIVLLVVDEAHRATGSYAYVEVVKFLRRFNTSFRVLALTATPGSSVEGVQEVIDGLGISRVEIRTEESIDIRKYVHRRQVDTILFDNSEEMIMIMDLFSKALQPTLNKLNAMNAYWAKDPMTLTPYGLTQARQKWMQEAGRNANFGIKGMVNSIFTILASLAHSIELLKFHGIVPFFHKVRSFREETPEGEKGSKYKREILDNESFQKMMLRIQSWVNNPNFVGHPKLDYLQGVILKHFTDHADCQDTADGPSSETKIMVFVHYRDSAEEVVRLLKRSEPMIRPHVFVGQANAKGSEGMDQKRQLDIISKFKAGTYNTLVATSIGEEGIDIGSVDLIVCYDASASPIRMLQRMGRTGRKRAGNIVITLMREKEEHNFVKAKDNYEKMQKMIADGTRFEFHDELSPRIVPRNVRAEVVRTKIEIPVENTQATLPEPKKRAKPPKRPPKKFHMPDGVRTGFTSASRMGGDVNDYSDPSDFEAKLLPTTRRSPTLEPIPSLESVALSQPQEKLLETRYLDLANSKGPQIVPHTPRLDAFPSLQRLLRPTKKIKHGTATKRVTKLLQNMHDMRYECPSRFLDNLHPKDREEAERQQRKRRDFRDGKSTPANDDDMEICGPLQAFSPTLKANSARKTTRQSASPSSHNLFPSSPAPDDEEEDEDDNGSDLADFIDDTVLDDVPGTPVSLASSPPLIDTKPKISFYEPIELMTKSGSQVLRDELPDFETLLGAEGVKAKVIQVSDDSEDVSRKGIGSAKRRRGRRAVVDSDSDGDDHG